ncbi:MULTISPECIES: hypothetical protein [unclassified Thioclava]|uniref:hypothetical protein n=1 Tax=unclassified Thioclava TaxID=2621713 RepID=UPI001412BA81|nr:MULTISPECIES: hypothetical protein [unclassified Thioclava]
MRSTRRFADRLEADLPSGGAEIAAARVSVLLRFDPLGVDREQLGVVEAARR